MSAEILFDFSIILNKAFSEVETEGHKPQAIFSVLLMALCLIWKKLSRVSHSQTLKLNMRGNRFSKQSQLPRVPLICCWTSCGILLQCNYTNCGVGFVFSWDLNLFISFKFQPMWPCHFLWTSCLVEVVQILAYTCAILVQANSTCTKLIN